MLCPNRSSSCDFLAEKAVENRKLTRNSRSLGEEGGIDNDAWTTKFILRCGIGKNVRRESQTAARLPALRRAHLPTAIAPRISSRQPENGRRAATISPISGTHNRQHEYPCCVHAFGAAPVCSQPGCLRGGYIRGPLAHAHQAAALWRARLGVRRHRRVRRQAAASLSAPGLRPHA